MLSDVSPFRLRALLLALIAGTSCWEPAASSAPTHGKTILFLWDRVTLDDLSREDLPTVQRLIRDGAVARINPRGAKGQGNLRATITLNTGTRADAREAASEMLMPDEWLKTEPAPAHEAYRRRSGFAPPTPRTMVNLNIGELLRLNIPPNVPQAVRVGALGDAVHAAGGLTAALGNSDIGLHDESGRNRFAPLAVMDGHGCVDLGDVGRGLLRRDSSAPFGLRTDRHKFMRALDAMLAHPRVRLIAVEVGDTFRANLYAETAPLDHAERLTHEAMQSADALLSDVMNRLDRQRDALFILSLSVPKLNQGELPPLIAWGKGFGPGLLTSGSTRRPGIVILPDLTSTLIAHVGGTQPSGLVGRVMMVTENIGASSQLRRLIGQSRTAVFTDSYLRLGLFILLGMLEAVVLMVVAVCIWQNVHDLQLLLRTALKRLLLLPLIVYLLNPTFQNIGLESDYLSFPKLCFVLGLGVLLFGRRQPPFSDDLTGLVWRGLPIISVSLLLFGCVTELDTAFGYSTYFGGRFYGLGNATMAMLIGCALSSIGWLPNPSLPMAAGIGGAVTLLLGHPQLGSNFGGAVGATCTFGILLLTLSGWKLTARHVIGLGIALVGVIVVLALLDARRSPEDRSHLGRLVATIQLDGFAPLTFMVINKARVWGHSFSHWYWDVALGAIVVSSLIVFGLCREQTARLLAARPALNASLVAWAIGGTITTLINDSGPVIPCLMSIYVLCPFFYVLLSEPPESERQLDAPPLAS